MRPNRPNLALTHCLNRVSGSFGCVRSRLLLRAILCCNLLLLALPANLHSQTTSAIEGRITDQQKLPTPQAEIHVTNPFTGVERNTLSGDDGAYRIVGVPAGVYTLSVHKAGFAGQIFQNLELTVNSTFTLDISLKVAARSDTVEVSAVSPLLDSNTSSTGATIVPRQISDMPINGRNYLDLLQLVPGVAVNRQEDSALDSATPILGERGGNAVFLIDGMPNRDEVNGGAAAQFNQDSILEFQVVTSGYAAEFGHGSGGVVNVLSKSGTNDWHGAASFFHRNYLLDSSDSPLVLSGNAPFLLRYDSSAQAGGPIRRDSFFLFASAERILESRQLNFQFPPATPPILMQLETPINLHSKTYDSRAHIRLDEQLARHRISQQFNLTNTHVTDFLPLLQALDLPSTRNNLDSRRLMLGLSDLAMLGAPSDPVLVNLYVQYRGEPSAASPAHPAAGTASTLANLFTSLNTGQLAGDLGQVQFGPGHTRLTLDQKYASLGANLSKQSKRHGWKLGWDFQRTRVDGMEANNLLNQLFATSADLGTFGAADAGVYFLNQQGGAAPQDNAIRLRDNYNGAYAQDDWKLLRNLTLNAGVRWDHDSRFPNQTNFSPRLGFAWSVAPKTVLTANWGLFYDHFRLGLARDIPAFGGANLVTQTFLSFPRLFYGDPSTLTILFATIGLPVPCASSNLTDAQIAAMGLTCSAKSASGANQPLYGIDHLNRVVAPGHAPIPANSVLNVTNVQALTGLTSQQFADAASIAVNSAPGLFSFDPFGNLTIGRSIFPSNGIPITVDPRFRTPFTNGFHFGIQREISSEIAIEFGYFHKSINNILGIRDTNLAFEARIPGHTGETVPAGSPLTFGYGPWFHGTYDSLTLELKERMTRRFTLNASYTWAHETDDALNSDLVSDLQTGLGAAFAASIGPTDSFVGTTTQVTDPVTGQTNSNGSFTASNGNPVPKAGIFYNGARLDKGPSNLAIDHTILIHGMAQLPWKVDVSGICRGQSGFHYSALFAANPPDVDGDNNFNGLDFTKGRNHFTAPPFVNLDARVAKRFDFGERTRLFTYLEFFNLFNRANPAAVNGLPPAANSGPSAPSFGKVLQVLPGREGQIGFKLEF